MPRPKRADEAGGLYHVLNRGNARAVVFHKDGDFAAFERILSEGLDRYDVALYAYQIMPNHWHMLLRPGKDGEMSRLLRWVTATHTMRYHAHYDSSGCGHVYQGRFKSFPVQGDDHFRVVCRYVERNALRAGLVERAEDWRWGSLWRSTQEHEPDPRLLSPWPVQQPENWIARANKSLTNKEIEAVRLCANRGRPLGDAIWTARTARRLGLESTLRSRGRPRVRPLPDTNKES
jgi:putative transposase